MQLEEAKKNLYEIIKLCEEELKNNDDNVSAILDLEDLKSLQTVLQALDNSVPKKVIEEYKNEFIEESKNQETFMTHSSQISASLISFCKELLKHSQVTIK